MRVGLPIFLTLQNRNWVGFLVFISAIFTYMPANHWPVFEPMLLPMTWIDQAVPFMPNTLWIYMSEWLLFPAFYLTARNLTNLNRYIYSFLALQLISVSIFWVWPTTFPRASFPLPEDLNAVTYYFFDNLRTIDTPASCCPSLHVSSVYLSAFLFVEEQRKKLIPALIWATAVAVSTLTTKQHYVIDLVTGLMLAVLCYWFFHHYATYREAGAQAKR